MADKDLILTSDDDGDTFETGFEGEDDIAPIDLLLATFFGPMFALREVNSEDKSLMICRGDGGDGSWEELVDPLTAAGGSATPSSLAYDILDDVLYITYIGETTVFALQHATEVDVAQCNVDTVAAGASLLDTATEFWKPISDMTQAPVASRMLVSQKKEKPDA